MDEKLKIAGELIANNRGDKQRAVINEALKEFDWDELKKAVELAEKNDQ